MDSLRVVFMVGEGRDRRIWEPDVHGILSVKSFYMDLWKKEGILKVPPSIWNYWVLLRVKTLGWMAGSDKIQTIDHLKNRRMLIIMYAPCV